MDSQSALRFDFTRAAHYIEFIIHKLLLQEQECNTVIPSQIPAIHISQYVTKCFPTFCCICTILSFGPAICRASPGDYIYWHWLDWCYASDRKSTRLNSSHGYI